MHRTLFNMAVLAILCFNSTTHANDYSNNKEDQIASLIKKVEYRTQQDEQQKTKLESQMLGRSTWKIQCKYKVFEDSRVCMMQKGDVSIMHLNDNYFVNIGNKVVKNSVVYVHVDKNNILQDRDGLFRNGNLLIKQFKRGNNIFIRYNAKNKIQEIERKISLLGFSDAFNDMENQYSRLDDDKRLSSL